MSRVAAQSGFVAGDRELELRKKLDAAIRVATAMVLHDFRLDQDEIHLILDRSHSSAPRIGELLVELGHLTRDQLAAELKDFQDL